MFELGSARRWREQYLEQWADAVELAAVEGGTAAMYAMIRRKYHPREPQATPSAISALSLKPVQFA